MGFVGEWVYRVVQGCMPENKKDKLKLLLMMPVYSGAGVTISLIYMIPVFQKLILLPLVIVLGAITCNLYELSYGLLFNKALKLNIWDYSHKKFNIMGQIDITHTIIWAVMTPVTIYFDQIIRYLAR
jgi:uncharacterized membrane protein